MNEKHNIWVFCGENINFIGNHTFQMLGKACQLHPENLSEVTAICIGDYCNEFLNTLFSYGADKILFQYTKNVDEDNLVHILEHMIRQYKPNLVLFPASSLGRMLSAVLATRLGSALTADCIDLDYDNKNGYLFLRAAISSSVTAKIASINSEVNICTVKKNTFPILKDVFYKTGKIEEYKYKILISKNKPYSSVKKIPHSQKPKISIENSKIVFGFGRGITDLSTLSLLYKVADKFGADVAGTRAVVEEGKIEKERQVGQSGISICPQLYIAFGISGANQHIVGIKNAKIIVAVNYDENAPIFDYADYKIVEDIYTILNVMDNLAINELEEYILEGTSSLL